MAGDFCIFSFWMTRFSQDYRERLDNLIAVCYNTASFIGQFVTILSVNKTRELDGRYAPVLFLWARVCPFFYLER